MTATVLPRIGTPCPHCAAPLVSERGARPWCERCAWGIDVYDPPDTTGWIRRRVGAVTFGIAFRLTMRQFRALAGGHNPYGHSPAGEPVVRPLRRRRLTGSRIAVTAFAILLYLFIVAIGAAGVALVLFRFPNVTLVPGALLVLIAIYLLPRFGRLPRHATVLTRAEAPALYALVDRVAVAAGSGPPAQIVVEPWFNASAYSVGIRRRRVLVLGLSLWGALAPQQRVGLLAHEMAHFSNGDVRRGLLVQPCLTTLSRLADLFQARSSPWGRRNLIGVAQWFADVLMRAISAVLFLAHLGVLAITLRDAQRAEYLADQRAATLAGTGPMTEVLDLLDTSADSVIASRARGQGLQDSWREAAAESLRDAAPARNRLRQLSTRTGASLWSTHPPLGLRAWLLEGAARHDPTLVLSPDESDRIDAELARYYRDTRRDIAHSRV